MAFRLTEEEWSAKQEKIKAFLADPLTSGGRDKLFFHVHNADPTISRRMVAYVLKNDIPHQLHRPLNKKITSRPIIVNGPGKVWAIDLIDVQKIKGFNDQKRYILTSTDLFGKFVSARAITNKQQTTVVKALLDILDSVPASWQPTTIQSDRGSEFSTGMLNKLAERGIKLIYSQAYNPQSNGSIERVNRTIKAQMFELMTRHDTKRYIEFLPQIIENINSTPHSVTRFVPTQLMNKKDQSTIDLVHQRMNKKIVRSTQSDIAFNLNDYVRVALITEAGNRKNKFKKRIEANWSPVIFQVYAISQPESLAAQPQYLLKNMVTNRKSIKRYFSYQLQKANAPEAVQPAEPETEQEEEEPPLPIAIAPPEPRAKRAWKPSAQALQNIANR